MSNFHYGDLYSCTYSSLLTVLAEVIVIIVTTYADILNEHLYS